MKKNIIVVAFYVCLVIIVITSFYKNKKDDNGEQITYSQIKQTDVKVKNTENDTQKVLHIKGDGVAAFPTEQVNVFTGIQ